MLPYLLLYLLLSINVLFFPSSRPYYLLSTLSILLFSAIRSDVGFDYSTYHDWATSGLDLVSDRRIEPFSKYLLYLSQYTGYPLFFFLITSAIIILTFSLFFLSASSSPSLSLLTFFCMPHMFLLSMGLVRQYTAIAITCYAIYYFLAKPLRYYLLITIASLFHYSSLILIFLPLVRRPLIQRHSLLFYLSVFSLFLALVSILLPVFLNHFGLYSLYLSFENTHGKTMILFYIIAACLVIPLQYRSSSSHPFTANLSILGSFLIFNLGLINPVFARLSSYFIPFFALSIPEALTCFKHRRLTLTITVILLGLVLLAQLLISSSDDILGPYLPYKHIFLDS